MEEQTGHGVQVQQGEDVKKQDVIPRSQDELTLDILAQAINLRSVEEEKKEFSQGKLPSAITLTPDIVSQATEVVKNYWRQENESGIARSEDLKPDILSYRFARTNSPEVHATLVDRITEPPQNTGVDTEHPIEHEWDRRNDMIGGLIGAMEGASDEVKQLITQDVLTIVERLKGMQVSDDMTWSPRLLRQKVVNSLLENGHDIAFIDLIEGHYKELGHTLMAKDSLIEVLQDKLSKVDRTYLKHLIGISFADIPDTERKMHVLNLLNSACESNSNAVQGLINASMQELIRIEQEKRNPQMSEEERKHSDVVINSMLGRYSVMPEGVVDLEAVKFLMQLADTIDSPDIAQECSAKITIGAGKDDTIPKQMAQEFVERHVTKQLPKDPSVYTKETIEKSLSVLNEMKEFLARQQRYMGWQGQGRGVEVERMLRPHLQALSTAATNLGDDAIRTQVRQAIRTFSLFTPPYINNFG